MFLGFNLKNFEETSLSKALIFEVFISWIFLLVYLHNLEQTIATAPFLTASLIYFSPFNF